MLVRNHGKSEAYIMSHWRTQLLLSVFAGSVYIMLEPWRKQKLTRIVLDQSSGTTQPAVKNNGPTDF